MANKEILNSLYQGLGQLATQLVVLASENDEVIQSLAEDALVNALGALTETLNQVKVQQPEGGLVTSESLAEMAAIASEFDKSGDPMLMKQAAVLDEILLTIGAKKSIVSAAKNAQDEEVAKIKAAQAEEYNPYTMVKAEHDKQNRVEETRKMISEKVKEYRPMEAPLNTRTCPDHPGAQMGRIAEHTFQCSLDKGIYNYQSGYVTMKGNKVPGGDVSNQTQTLFDRPNEFMSFETRESKLNQS